MSDLTTYKATFKTANKYLKYFCDKPASDWTFKKYKKHFSDKDPEKIKKIFLENLKVVKDDSKNLSTAVKQHINTLMELNESQATNTPSSSSNITNNIMVKGNYYNADGNIVINNQTAERSVKKQKTCHEENKEMEKNDFKQKWIEFLADAEHNRNFHRYSPEKNGVTRLGKQLSPHPNADKETYRHSKKELKPCGEPGDISLEMESYVSNMVAANDIDEFEESVENTNIPPVEDQKITYRFINDIFKIMIKVYKKKPTISRSEVVYNTNMIFPCIEAMLIMMKKNEYAPYFTPGEDELAAMTSHLKKMGCKIDKRKIYKADGIIRLAGLEDVEVLVLETAGAFNYNCHSKESFDNSKGMFALLSMLKTVADHYKHASVEEFRKLKFYLIQPSDTYIRLWSMQYTKHGLYNFVREKKIIVGEDFEQRRDQISSLVNFFLILKNCLEETIKTVAMLKEQHEEKEKCHDSENNSQEILLSDIICPKIFKLSYNTHGQKFANEHFQSSPESDF